MNRTTARNLAGSARERAARAVHGPSGLARFADLSWFLALSSLRKEARQNLFGYLWWILEPAMHTLLYYVVFAVVMRNPQENFFAILICGVAFWRWFGSGVSNGAVSAADNGPFLRTFDMSTFAFVAAASIEAAVRILPVMLLAAVAIRAPGQWLSPADIWILPVAIVQALLILGLSSHLSWIMVYVPDTRQAVEIALRIGLFLSGVFYATESAPEHVRWLFAVNPEAVVIGAARAVLVGREAPEIMPLLWVAAVSALLCVTGVAMHRRIRGRVATLLLQ